MNEPKTPDIQSQQAFLRGAMAELNMTRAQFARRISVPNKTLDKWLASPEAGDFRNMPEVVWAYVREILAWNKKNS